MRRFSGRSVAVVVLALCLSVVPVGVASASPWAGFGLEGGFFAKVELLLARVVARFEVRAEVPQREWGSLKEGNSMDPNGSN